MIIYILSFTLILTLILRFDTNITLYIDNYEIFTNTRFIFIIFLILLVFGFIINNIIDYFKYFKFNKDKKYYKYFDKLYNSIIFAINGDKEKSSKFLNSAKRICNSKLNDVLDVILNNTDKKIGNGLFNYNIELSKALQNNDNSKIIEYSKKILDIQKNNKYCLELLYKAYNDNRDLISAYNLVKNNKKIYKKELKDIYKNLAVYFYNIKNYNESFKFSELFFKKYCKNNQENNEVLLNSLVNLNLNKEFNKYLKIVWKHTPIEYYGKLYIKNNYKKVNKLYKINKSNIISVIFYCKTMIENKNYVKSSIIDKIKFDDKIYRELSVRNKDLLV